MAMIDIALRHEREMQRNDTQPYDKIMSDLTREIEDALDDKISRTVARGRNAQTVMRTGTHA